MFAGEPGLSTGGPADRVGALGYNGCMALRLRRHTPEPRFELTPLLDVIFLLLTFFIYSQVLLIRPYILPVALPRVTAGQTAEPARVWGVTLDSAGQLYLNEEPIDLAGLQQRLGDRADQPADDRPQIFVALEAVAARGPAPVDRGLMLVELMDTLRAEGIDQYGLVVKPEPGSGGGSGSTPGAAGE